MALVAIVPAAGYGTRLARRHGSKEMLVLGGRPLIEHVIRRMQIGAVSTVRVVTRPEKVDLVTYATRAGFEVILGHPSTLAASLRLGMAGLARDDVVVCGFPDSIWSPLDGCVQLLSLHRTHPDDIALGLFEADELQRMEAVHSGEDGRVSAIEFRPKTPTTRWMWGCMAARVATLHGMQDYAEPGHFLDAQARAARVWAVRLGRYVDVGTPPALSAARRDPIVRL